MFYLSAMNIESPGLNEGPVATFQVSQDVSVLGANYMYVNVFVSIIKSRGWTTMMFFLKLPRHFQKLKLGISLLSVTF